MTPPGFPTTLAARVDALYSAFGPYPLRRHVEGCSCGCIPPGAEAKLHRRALRELGRDDLGRYASKAMTTWGDVEDFKYFLPRLLELLVHKGFPVDTETVLGKLRYGHWETWPPREQEAVRAFLEAWWVAVLSRTDEDYPWEVDALLGGLAQAEEDLTPYLAQWDALQTSSALSHLAAFVVFHEEERVRGAGLGAFWENRPHQARQVLTWLRTERQQGRLERASAVSGASPSADTFRQSVLILRAARGRGPAQ